MRISLALLAPALAQGVLIAAAGIVLFFAPTTGHDIWGWQLTPFNTRFLGAIYLAAVVDFAALAAIRKWSIARLVVPMDFLFTSILLCVSLAHVHRFAWDRPVTWGWFTIFCTVPCYSGYLLLRLRRADAGASRCVPSRLLLPLRAGAAALAAYGIGLLAAPGTLTGFWPWPIDEFHARVYSGIFATLALGAVISSRAAAPIVPRVMGLTLVAFGALVPAGLLVVDANVHTVDWSRAGTWLWIAIFAALVAAGVALSAAGGWRESDLPEAVTA